MNNLLTQKFPIAAFALLFVLTLSCSHDPHDENQDPSNTDVHEWEDSTLSGDAVMGSAMTFKVGGGMSVERTAQTRVTTDIDGVATFTEGDLVAVAVTRSGGSEVVKLYRVKNDGSLEYAGGDNNPFVWKSASETVSLRAWSYGTSTNLSYTLTAPETRDYTLETDQQNNGYRELLYCKAANKSHSENPISLTFYHQLTRIVVNVNHEQTGSLSINSASIGGNSFPIAAGFTVPEGNSNVGTWTTRATYNSITPKTENTQSGYQRTYSVVIFPKTYVKDSKIFTISNDDGNYTYSINEAEGQELTAGNQYNYTITVKNGYKMKAGDYIKYNPLWYVAQYNMASNTAFETSHYANYPYGMVWSYESAVSAFTSITIESVGYHLPTKGEQRSIIAPYTAASGGYWTHSLNFTETETCVSKDRTTTLPDFYSVWSGIETEGNDGWKYAIRYVSTNLSVNQYCSAWRYKWVESPCCGVRIESYVLNKAITTLEEAKAILPELKNSPVWNGAANVTCTSAPTNTSLVMRFIPACGSTNPSPASFPARANYRTNVQCYYWSSTPAVIWECTAAFLATYTGAGDGTGRSIRLFRN